VNAHDHFGDTWYKALTMTFLADAYRSLDDNEAS
jgi:hypothetical protein